MIWGLVFGYIGGPARLRGLAPSSRQLSSSPPAMVKSVGALLIMVQCGDPLLGGEGGCRRPPAS